MIFSEPKYDFWWDISAMSTASTTRGITRYNSSVFLLGHINIFSRSYDFRYIIFRSLLLRVPRSFFNIFFCWLSERWTFESIGKNTRHAEPWTFRGATPKCRFWSYGFTTEMLFMKKDLWIFLNTHILFVVLWCNLFTPKYINNK